MQSVSLCANAKINWTLDITGTDEKGYHLLDMLMQSVSLADRVDIQLNKGFSLKTDREDIPCDERNTASKAAKYFFEYLNKDIECAIQIKKNIPSGAGLGGGSADAAAVLKGLNMLYSYPVPEKDLFAMALKIGADVPFMLAGGACRARGIGEQMEKINSQKYVLLLAMDEEKSASTKEVYRLFDSLKDFRRPDNDGFANALENRNYENMRKCAGNVLTGATRQIVPKIDELIGRMDKAKFASMTGSGSAVFGVYESEAEAKEQQKNFCDVWSQVVYTL